MGQVLELNQNWAKYKAMFSGGEPPVASNRLERRPTLGVTWDKRPISATSMGPVTRDGRSFRNGTVYQDNETVVARL
jgi:hypothetical protein